MNHYRRLKRALWAIGWAVRELGIGSTAAWLGIRAVRAMRLPEPGYWHVKPRMSRYPVHIRLAGRSDIFSFGQIFVNHEYAPLRDLGNVSTILDLGSNVGFASSFFLSCFPKSRVLAVEPDAQNFTLCRQNLQPFGDRAKVLRGAAWSECTSLFVPAACPRGHEWGIRVNREPERGHDQIAAWDLPTLIKMTEAEHIDLLKIDIEGAETEVFRRDTGDWLRRVRNLCIELHGRECDEAFFSALSGFEYDLSYSEELTICRNLRPRSAQLDAGTGGSQARTSGPASPYSHLGPAIAEPAQVP